MASSKTRLTSRKQRELPFSPLRNSELFSNHWLANRLPLEPEWNEVRQQARQVLEKLVALWEIQRPRVAQYGSEQALEQAFIQPVLKALGWKLIYQTHLRGGKPDYALFTDDASLDGALATSRLSPEFWQRASIVADAKAWSIPLDRPISVGKRREYPPEQIERYLNNSLLAFGLLTNGRYWRLVPREHYPGQPRFQTYLECDLERLLSNRLKEPVKLFEESQTFEDFLRFFLLFSPTAFSPVAERPPLIERARNGSTEYRLGVGKGLKERVFEALCLCIGGFLSHVPNGLRHTDGLEICRQNSLVLLYRLLFVLFAEDRKLLPYGLDRAYTSNRSLGRFRDEISGKLERIEEGRDAEYPEGSCDLWDDLLNLFNLIDEGAGRYKVPAYNGGLFDASSHPFLSSKKIPDRHLARVIDHLGRALDPAYVKGGLVRVDYRDLAIQHLGNVYEGLLELQPHFASEDMAVIRKRSNKDEERVIPRWQPIPHGFEYAEIDYRKGSVYLLTAKGERRASGSYYTPNAIVDEIVENTLAPLCEEIERALRQEIANAERQLERAPADQLNSLSAEIEKLGTDFDDRVLRLRVLDPAMGSGHFLLRACQYLAEQIATNPYAKEPEAEGLQGEESTLTYWKRRVVERCLYGVDLNPLAVELAKLALWLETVAIGQPLTFLNYHLRDGNSLIGVSVDALRTLPNAPPLMTDFVGEELRDVLPLFFQALDAIILTSSKTLQEVKKKERIFREKLEPIREPLRHLADMWCSTFFLPPTRQLNLGDYQKAASKLKNPAELQTLLKHPPFQAALEALTAERVVPLHWELEFPEVFFHLHERLANPGFNAILGNPPYDVLSEKETGCDLSSVKDFYRFWPLYRPSFIGKNNLYKLFVCRALDLLADGGRLGFITPMPILGDEQASGIRKEILRLGAFNKIEAFPQKDNPDKRVFRDAKLSTAIVIAEKTKDPRCQKSPFALRVHPENKIEPDSPMVKMTSKDIPLYDPENMTIVSCSQEDWDLAVRIMHSDRLERLGCLCIQYQGEVNETNETPRGSLSDNPETGPQVLRGSNICLYALREASQGEDLYLSKEHFLKGKGKDSKAYSHRYERIGFQRSSPQNNFRRIIACPIPKGQFCFDTVSFVPENETGIAPFLILALLNSKLLDWYFRLGSTNSKVNEYQFKILPCPRFSRSRSEADHKIQEECLAALHRQRLPDVVDILKPSLKEPPFSIGVADTMIEAVRIIISIESARKQSARSERSELASEAQPYQDLLDTILYKTAGLGDEEVHGLERRLSEML